MSLRKKVHYLLASTFLLGATSVPGFANEIALSGSVACPAAYFMRKEGKEIHDRVFGLRNFNDKRTVTITRVRAWDNDGMVTFDGLPAVAGFKSTLPPNVSAGFYASDVLPVAKPPNNIQQIRLDYKLDRPGIPLHVGFAHVTKKLDGYQSARHGGKCTNIPPGVR